MAFNIIFKKSIQRDLKRIPRGEAFRILDLIEAELRLRPDAYPALKGPYSGLRKLRVGDYRVIFVLLEGDVVVLRIGHRQDVYKNDPPRVSEDII